VSEGWGGEGSTYSGILGGTLTIPSNMLYLGLPSLSSLSPQGTNPYEYTVDLLIKDFFAIAIFCVDRGLDLHLGGVV